VSAAKTKPTQLSLALSACLSIRFACAQAVRHGGEFSLNDILAAKQLASEAINYNAPAKPKWRWLRTGESLEIGDQFRNTPRGRWLKIHDFSLSREHWPTYQGDLGFFRTLRPLPKTKGGAK
jgi:hypothetical protein